MRNSDDPFYGHMPRTNIHDDETRQGAQCCMNLTANCIGAKCMAWRWLWRGDKQWTYFDDDGIEHGVGWCGLAAYPLIGREKF